MSAGRGIEPPRHQADQEESNIVVRHRDPATDENERPYEVEQPNGSTADLCPLSPRERTGMRGSTLHFGSRNDELRSRARKEAAAPPLET